MLRSLIVVGFVAGDPQGTQAVTGEGQELLADQPVGRHRAPVEPAELRLQTEAGGGEEVLLGGIELEVSPDVAVPVRQRFDQA